MKTTILLSALVLCSAFVVGSALADHHEADGAAVYKTACASCHGEDGSGDTPVGKAMNIGPLKGGSADAVAKHVKEAPNHAQVMGKLSDAELAAVAAHVAGF